MSKATKESIPLKSCNNIEDNSNSSFELTPDVIAFQRQLQLERESRLETKQQQQNNDKIHKCYHTTLPLGNDGDQKKNEEEKQRKGTTTTNVEIIHSSSSPLMSGCTTATKESIPMKSCSDVEDNSNSSFELTPDVIAFQRQLQLERESRLETKQQQQNNDKINKCYHTTLPLGNDGDQKKNVEEKQRKGTTTTNVKIIHPSSPYVMSGCTTASIPNNNNDNNKKSYIRRTADSDGQVTNIPGAFAIRGINSCEEDDDDEMLNDSTLYSKPKSNPKLIVAENVNDEEFSSRYEGLAKEQVRQRIQKEAIKASLILGSFEMINGTKSRWELFYCILGFVILVSIVAVVAGVFISKKQQKQQGIDLRTFPPTTSPLSLFNFIKIQEQMKYISGDIVFDDSSPQYQALSWLAYDDLFMLDSAADELVDRYILAVIYFSTGGHKWLNDLNFLTNSSICNWNKYFKKKDGEGIFKSHGNGLSDGVHCDNRGVITKILLDRNNLNGTIPHEIGTALEYVEEISVSNNHLYSTIPSTLGNLFRLEFLDLSSNDISGTIPNSFSHLIKLEYFSTRSNYLTGTIPSGITNLISLERLDLSINQLSGSIPEFFSSSSNTTIIQNNNLEYLSIFDNILNGTLPESIIQLSNLEVLNLSNNFITGTLPLQLGLLKNLIILFLFQNEINGSLPISIGNLDVLTTLALDYNSFIGTIPSEIGKLRKLQHIYLDHNRLSGTIPIELGQSINMYGIYLQHNPNLNGTIPDTLSSMNRLEHLHLVNTGITGSLDSLLCPRQIVATADCGGLSPSVNCTCCTECCDPILGICEEDNEQVCDVIESIASSAYGFTVNCTCRGIYNGFTCTNEGCPTCNEDNTICGTAQSMGHNQTSSHFSKTYQNIFQYTIGRNESIIWYETPEVNCKVWINGQQCNECSLYYCRDGFPARHIDCTNIVDFADGGIYDTCQHYENGGIFEYISWFDTLSFTGCIPFYYRPLQ